MAAYLMTTSAQPICGRGKQLSSKVDRRPFSCSTCRSRQATPICQAGSADGATSRRQVIELAGLAALTAALPSPAFAASKGGFNVVKDQGDAYTFQYPFGWQEVEVKGQDVVYKDIIEPLESASVSIATTDKTDITEFGEPVEVAFTLADKVLTPPNQQVKVLNVTPKSLEGRNYIEFEFAANAGNYIRHALAVVTIANGKLYTLVTGANEKRWGKMADRLQTVAKSFVVSTKY